MGLSGAADTILVLKRARKENTGTLFVTGRDVAEQELAVEFNAEKGTWKNLGDAKEVHISEARQEIIRVLKKMGRPAKPHEVAELVGKNREAVKRLMLNMGYAGLLQSHPGGTYSLKEEKVIEIPRSPHSPIPDSPRSPDSPHSPPSPESPGNRGSGNRRHQVRIRGDKRKPKLRFGPQSRKFQS